MASASNKRTICPACGGSDVDAIYYGLPGDYDPERDKANHLRSGGCMVSHEMPDRACNTCEHLWQSDTLAERMLSRRERSDGSWPGEILDTSDTL
jgi:RNA polymerase subunit RPABC4/transcription elongation factor Spt4